MCVHHKLKKKKHFWITIKSQSDHVASPLGRDGSVEPGRLGQSPKGGRLRRESGGDRWAIVGLKGKVL